MLRSLIIAVFMLAFAQRARAQQPPPGQPFPQRTRKGLGTRLVLVRHILFGERVGHLPEMIFDGHIKFNRRLQDRHAAELRANPTRRAAMSEQLVVGFVKKLRSI